MRITVNGETLLARPGSNITDILGQLGITGARVAVELNREIVPRSEHQTCALKEGDVVEIVHAIGGG